jgi:hypothetical protein
MLAFPCRDRVVARSCGPRTLCAAPEVGAKYRVRSARRICRPFVDCQPHSANPRATPVAASQRARRSKPRNSAAHSLSRCDGVVRTPWCEPGATAVAVVAAQNLRNSAAFGWIQCDRVVRTSSATAGSHPSQPETQGTLRLTADRVRTSVRRVRRIGSHLAELKTLANLRLSGRRCDAWVRTANPGFRAVASEVSGGAPRTRFGPGRTLISVS